MRTAQRPALCPEAVDWEELRTAALLNRQSKGELNGALVRAWNALHPEEPVGMGQGEGLDGRWGANRERLIDELDYLRPDWRGYLCSYQRGAQVAS